MKNELRALMIVGLAGCAPQPAHRAASPAAPPSPIDTMRIREVTRFLSDDALLGRMTGTKEADIAALYIQSACIGIGFSPVADKNYLQTVNMSRTTINGAATTLTIRGPRGTRKFDYQVGFIPNTGLDGATHISGPAMYVGTSDDITHGRTQSLDLKGAVAIVGGSVSDAADDTLDARQVAAVIQLTGDEQQYVLYVRSRGDSRLQLVDSSTSLSVAPSPLSLVASPRLSHEIVAGISPPQGPARLDDSISVELSLDQKAVKSSNVGCLLEGSDPKVKDSAIAFTAHYDHLGVSMPDSRGDSIYNGFSDNAAGVAMLLTIGDALAHRGAGKPRHSVLLLFFTGEEEGLLGSDYYVAHPLWPIQRTRAVINLDAGAPPARPWSWRLAGGNSALAQLAQDVAAERGWSATTSPATPNSDYYPFSRAGVQSIFIIPGSAPYQGLTADSSQALRRRWDHYHDPADEWVADFPFAGLGRYAEYAYYVARVWDGTPMAADRRPGAPLPNPH